MYEPDAGAGDATTPGPELLAVVAELAARPVPPALASVVATLSSNYGDSLDAVLFYGSCLRNTDVFNGLVDVYALVDGYRHAYPRRALRWLNRALAPNVFYLECSGDSRLIRVKCAVLSTRAFERGVERWFHPYLWGRFAQPVRVLYARDSATRTRVNRALARAVVRFVGEVAGCLVAPFSAEQLWVSGLRRSYATELRVEGKDRAAELFDASRGDYLALTSAAAAAAGLRTRATSQYELAARGLYPVRAVACGKWLLRRWQGRALSILRLIKNSYTFRGGVDYLVWKIERHTGVRVEVTPQLRRYPLIYGWSVLFRLLRAGVLR
ncbi:MAG TPA: hypothetical protein VFQ88_11850 [Nevskiaceae bacterium]|nr:hypothetical protein [Nevskiaceae bacterium]